MCRWFVFVCLRTEFVLFFGDRQGSNDAVMAVLVIERLWIDENKREQRGRAGRHAR
jgi:hypothetical protein